MRAHLFRVVDIFACPTHTPVFMVYIFLFLLRLFFLVYIGNLWLGHASGSHTPFVGEFLEYEVGIVEGRLASDLGNDAWDRGTRLRRNVDDSTRSRLLRVAVFAIATTYNNGFDSGMMLPSCTGTCIDLAVDRGFCLVF